MKITWSQHQQIKEQVQEVEIILRLEFKALDMLDIKLFLANQIWLFDFAFVKTEPGDEILQNSSIYRHSDIPRWPPNPETF